MNTDDFTPNDGATPLCVNNQELMTFYGVLFKNAKNGYISLRGFSKDKTAFIESYHFNDSLLLSALERLATRAAHMENVVFCSPIVTFQNDKKANDQNVSNGLAISVDLDHTNPQTSRQLLEKLLGPATIVVASGGEWLDKETGESYSKLHLHWRLKEPTDNQEKHTELKKVRRMAAELVGGDTSGAPPAHPFRWPGSWHTKAEPIMCRIIELREDVEIKLEEATTILHDAIKKSYGYNEVNQYSGHPENQNTPISQRNTKYAQVALEKELSELKNAREGGRNTALNKASFALGQLIAGGLLSRLDAENALGNAAFSIGLEIHETEKTIKSGIEAGIASPRTQINNPSAPASSKDGEWVPTLRTGAEIQSMDIKIEWLIEDILPKNSVTLLFGRGGIGKTTLALQINDAISSGKAFLGMPVENIPVLYVDYENSLAILSDRLKKVGGEKVLFWPAEDAPAHLDRDPNVYFNLLKKYPYAVFIFDTLRSSQSGDENDSRSMALVLQTMRTLRDYGATIVLLHHTKKGADETYKGSTAIFDLVDNVIGLYPIKGANNDQECDGEHVETSKQIFYFGTKDKTRFQPFKRHLRFDTEQCLFVLASDPTNISLERIRELIPETGIIQKDLVAMVNNRLNIGEKKIQLLLKQGTGSYWSAEKNPKQNNAVIYKPFRSFSAP